MVDLNGKRILVTGGDGFVGRFLVRKLVGAEVCVFDKSLGADITDFDKVREKVNSFKPDIIFHLAALISNDGEVMKVNYEATKNLLDCYDGYEKFVYVSTGEVYAGNEVPFNEGMEVSFRSPYSESKFKSEKYCLDLIGKGKPIVIVRPSLIYGVGQRGRMFIPSLVRSLLSGENFKMSLGEQSRDFVFVEDLVEMLVKILEKDVKCGVFNCGSGVEVKLKDAVKLVKDITGSDSKVLFGALDYRDNEIMRYVFDVSRAKNVLEWLPKVSLEDGLRKVINSYK